MNSIITKAAYPAEIQVPLTQEPAKLSSIELESRCERIADLLHAEDATVIAHYYTDDSLQYLADFTEGRVADSLAMAEYGRQSSANTLVVCGVRFMGETAKILSPEKRVIMPTLAATCSLDLGCPADAFAEFCKENSDRTVVVYANTAAAVKACADWVVTSSNALAIVEYLVSQGKKILWGPDRYLGAYIQKQTGADLISWQGACVVHEEFKTQALKDLIKHYPNAAVLVHPESPESVVELADVVGSTTKLLNASRELPNKQFIVATDRGIFYRMQQLSPDKEFMLAPTAGHGATCRSCGHCPWMAMNALDNLELSLLTGNNEIELSDDVIAKAKIPLQRMMDFSYA